MKLKAVVGAIVGVTALVLVAAPSQAAAQSINGAQANVPAPSPSPAASRSPTATDLAGRANREATQTPDPSRPQATPSPSQSAPTADGRAEAAQTSEAIRIAIVLTLLALIPAVAICMTPFIRIVVVLSMVRHAFGMPETPPNQVLISLALFLTAFSMMPTLRAVTTDAIEPFLAGSISVSEAVERGSGPARTFMLRQVHDQDIKTIYEIAKQPLPNKASDVSLVNLIPAFMLNELRVSFKMGFVIFLPFLLIDIVVASILLSLGMLMVPPATISLPIKILMFVLIDGWSLVLQSVVASIK